MGNKGYRETQYSNEGMRSYKEWVRLFLGERVTGELREVRLKRFGDEGWELGMCLGVIEVNKGSRARTG